LLSQLDAMPGGCVFDDFNSQEEQPSILALEDEDYRIGVFEEMFAPHTVVATDFVPEFLKLAERGSWRLILMDHDLSTEADAITGVDASIYLADPEGAAFAASSHTPIVVHSLNLPAAGEMLKCLWTWEGPLIRVPFHRLPEYGSWLMSLIG